MNFDQFIARFIESAVWYWFIGLAVAVNAILAWYIVGGLQ